MRIHNAGSSFVLTCPCGLRETFHLRRDAQQALGRHGDTCGMGFGGSAEGGKAAVRPVAAPESDAEAPEAESLHHDHDDQREAGR